MQNSIILLGSNMGERQNNLNKARHEISDFVGKILKSSLVMETQAWPDPKDPSYLNQVILVETNLEPESLMRNLLTIERKLGRTRSHEVRYAPRNIDLDILEYADVQMQTPALTLPHPQIENRDFVVKLMSQLS